MKRSNVYLIVVIALFSVVLLLMRNNNQVGKSRVKNVSAINIDKIFLKRLEIKTPNEFIVLHNDSTNNDNSIKNDDAATNSGKKEKEQQSISSEMWTIGDKHYKSDETKVKELLNAIITNMKLELVSDITNEKSQYNLGAENYIEVKLYGVANKKGTTTTDKEIKLIRHLYIGKNATTYNHVYVSLANSDNIYQVAMPLRSTFDITADVLRDKNVLNFSARDIDNIEIQLASGRTTVLKKAALPDPDASTNEGNAAATRQLAWQDEKGNRYKDIDLNNLMNVLSTLTCKEFLPQTKAEIALNEKVDRVLTINAISGKKYVLYLLKKKTDDNETRAYSSATRFAFILENNNSEILLKPLEKMVQQ